MMIFIQEVLRNHTVRLLLKEIKERNSLNVREMWGQLLWEQKCPPFLASEKTLKGDYRFNIFI